MEFTEVVSKRRSTRKFTNKLVPPEVIWRAIRHALIAPNSSNMQAWEFYWVKDPEKKRLIVEACFSQPAAKTAAEIVVVVTRRDTWRRNRKLMLEKLSSMNAPRSALHYYQKIVPMMYRQGWFGILGHFTGWVMNLIGIFRPVPRGPFGIAEQNAMLMKSAALACENFMLSIVDQGFATCPMEGFDEVRVKRVLKMGPQSRIVMCLGIGDPDPTGVWGPQIRFDEGLFVFEI